MFLPRERVSAAGDATEITLLTFNIEVEAAQLQPLTDIILEANADVVALQEVSHQAAAHFETALAEVYPYMALYPHDNPYAGQALLSRFPIESSEYWRNEELDAKLGHMRATLDIEGTQVGVYNVHPVPPFSNWGFNAVPHDAEMDSVLARVRQETDPVIVLGDFNMTDQFDDYRQLTDLGFVDTFRHAGWGFGFTFPAEGRLPAFLRLDYVFHDATFTGVEARVWPEAGPSDHHPVFARLNLLPAD
jgi:endonuclease/exonuclease/phosphatase (EEP) superfamily protein YafD